MTAGGVTAGSCCRTQCTETGSARSAPGNWTRFGNNTMPNVTHLECSVCGKPHRAGIAHNLCECGGPLLVIYDLDAVRANWTRDLLDASPADMWRYSPVLPVADPKHVVSMGEGWTPLIRARRLGELVGAGDLWVKDEGL